eukprot:TRINITY_DN3309_c0_g1_i7.p1 TRINITY_DN3309_c0_g1~~TRINITY_DN3309_c0_g1_i7.p1  ORF type:complete len:737 (+),score=179.01 TRINITY_DN3309_c0_g1_i7:438-2648(+)
MFMKVFWMHQEVALKCLRFSHPSEAPLKEMEKQALVISKFRHPSLVTYYGTILAPPNYCKVMEYCKGGTLLDAIKDPLSSLPFLLVSARSVASALAFLHQHKLLHGNLKPTKILFDCQKRAKLADFGFSTSCVEGHPVTTAYTAPEVLEGSSLSTASDVYSFGCPLWQIDSRSDHQNKNPVKPTDQCHPKLKSLILKCTTLGPNQRPDMEEVLEGLSDLLKDLGVDAPVCVSLPPPLSLGALPVVVDLSNNFRISCDEIVNRMKKGTTILKLNGCPQVNSAICNKISTFSSIKQLHLSKCTRIATDGFLSLFSAIPELEVVDVSNCKISESAWQCLATNHSKTLTEINISNCSVQDSHMKAIAKLTKLRKFIAGNALSADELSSLEEIVVNCKTTLNVLDCRSGLFDQVIPPSLFTALEGLKKLEWINLERWKVDNGEGFLKMVKRHQTTLERVVHPKLSTTEVKQLKEILWGCHQLKELDVEVVEEDVAQVLNLEKLETLPKLATLNSLGKLLRMKNLVNIHLADICAPLSATVYTNMVAEVAAAASPTWTSLSIGLRSGAMSSLRSIFSKSRDLQSIIFRPIGNGVLKDVLNMMRETLNCSSLTSIHFSCSNAAWGDFGMCGKPEDAAEEVAALTSLLKDCPAMESIKIYKGCNVKPIHILSWTKMCPNLKLIDLNGGLNGSFSLEEAKEMFTNCPMLIKNSFHFNFGSNELFSCAKCHSQLMFNPNGVCPGGC